MSIEIFDFLKCERDICVKIITANPDLKFFVTYEKFETSYTRYLAQTKYYCGLVMTHVIQFSYYKSEFHGRSN